MSGRKLPNLKNEIDFNQLEEELKGEIQSEKLYKRENDAKIRAMHQGTQTYEEFRQLVVGSNLNPLEKKEKEDLAKASQGKVVWNKTI